MSLISFLLDDGLRIQLRSFCKKEYSSENVDFWFAVEQFRSNHEHMNENNDGKRLYEEGKNIFEDFIGAGSPREVNIPSGIASKIQVLPKDEIPRNFFDEAQSEIYELMERDTFSRFKTDLNNKYCKLEEDIVYMITNIIKDPNEDPQVMWPALQLLAQLLRSTSKTGTGMQSKHEAIVHVCLAVIRGISDICDSTDVSFMVICSKVIIEMIACLKDWATSCPVSCQSEKALFNKTLTVLLDVSKGISATAKSTKRKSDELKKFFLGGNDIFDKKLRDIFRKIQMSGAEALSHVLKFHNAPEGIDLNVVEADQEDREENSNAIHFGFRGRLISFM